MLAETVTRLEMSWKKLLRAEKGAEADREKSSEKGTGRETDRGKNEMEEQGRGGGAVGERGGGRLCHLRRKDRA